MAEGKTPKRAADTPTGAVTFLFTDIEGSTKLWEDYPARMPEVLERHDEILRSAVEDHNGYVFKTVGDAFCAAFSHPRKALKAALDAQRALFTERWGKPIRSLRVRMALHTGYAELERDGDYFGPAVNRVARLISLAYGGQVLLSGTTHDQVCDHPEMVDERVRLVELGEHPLKDLNRPERVFQLAVPDLPERFPPLRTAEAPEEDRYRIKAFLGGGGMAKVYLAHDEVLDRDVAYKVLHPWYLDDEEFVERFRREAKNAAKLNHPNIVAIHDRGEKEDGAYYMVMEHLQGGTLRDLIKREAPLPTHEALEMTLQIAQALSEAHEQGVIHRDIKPENVLLNKRGEVKVGDFGIAKAAAASTRLTRTGIIPGTAAYVSPEQIKGEEATFRSDLYALGIVLYEMLTKELPFGSKTTEEILRKHLYEQACPPREINPGVPDRVEAVCTRLMAKDPKERYPGAGALIGELKGVLSSLEDEGGTVVEQPPSSGSVTQKEELAETVPEETTAAPSVIEVPDLTGQNVFQVSGTLANSGLTLGHQEEVPSETVAEGEIMGQVPEVGTEVEPNTLVSVTVSSGPSTVEVPNLVGQKPPQARSKLAEADLKLGGKNEAPSDTVSKGRIAKQEPAAGTKAERGSSVSVTVSSGRQQKETIADLSTRQSTTEGGPNRRPRGAQVRDERSPHSPPEQGKRSLPTRTTPPDSPPSPRRNGGKRHRGALFWTALAGLVGVAVALVVGAITLQGGTGEDTNFTLTSTLSGHSGWVISVAFSPDGKLLASGGLDGTVKLWDPQSGKELQTLGGYKEQLRSVAFSPDGKLLVSGGTDKTVKLWDPQSGKGLQTLGHSNAVESVAFSPDGKLLASGSDTVNLWDPQSGKELQTLSAWPDSVSSVAFSPDGKLLASGSEDGTVELWARVEGG